MLPTFQEDRKTNFTRYYFHCTEIAMTTPRLEGMATHVASDHTVDFYSIRDQFLVKLFGVLLSPLDSLEVTLTPYTSKPRLWLMQTTSSFRSYFVQSLLSHSLTRIRLFRKLARRYEGCGLILLTCHSAPFDRYRTRRYSILRGVHDRERCWPWTLLSLSVCTCPRLAGLSKMVLL